MSTILDSPVLVNLDPFDTFHPSAEDAIFAAAIFGPISQARDEDGPDDFAIEPIDDDRAAETVRRIEEREAYTLPDDLDGDDLDGWDSEPDLDTLAGLYEEMELCEAGIGPANRGFFGHDDHSDRPSIHDECVAIVQAEVFRLTGHRISPAEAEIRMAGAWARTWGR